MAFNWLKNMLTGLPRGIGQLVQGKPRGAIGAFSDVVKPLAIAGSAVPGPHQALTIPLAAVAGAGQKFDDEGNRGLTDILSGAAEGASLAVGTRGLSSVARSGYGAITGGAPRVVSTGTLPRQIPAVAESLVSTGSNVASNPSFLSKAGSYLVDNPEIPLGVAELGLGYASERERGGAIDRRLAMEEEDRARLRQIQELQALFSLFQRSRTA